MHRTRSEILKELSNLVKEKVENREKGYWATSGGTYLTGERFRVRWQLTMLSGCCGVGVISNTTITNPNKRKDGKVRELVAEFQEAHAREVGRYGAVIQTHREKNYHYQSTTSARGYVEAANFKNPKSGSRVTIDVIEA